MAAVVANGAPATAEDAGTPNVSASRYTSPRERGRTNHMSTDFEHDELRALNTCDDIRQGTGLDLAIWWSGRKNAWLAGLNNPGAIPAEFDSVDDAIDWAYWYAGH